MEKRRLGKTEHQSTVVTFGTAAIGHLDQRAADASIEEALNCGINHFDVAPTYGDAELRLGDYLRRHPQPDLFISCKTHERNREDAAFQLHRTLERLGRDRFDLYQLHAVLNMEDLERCFADGGVMEAILAARDEGLVTHIGITGHGWESAAAHRAALERFDFATVMTSANVYMMQQPEFRRDWDALLETCQRQDVGVQVLKAIAKTAWGERDREFATWYEPITDQSRIDAAVAWVLNQPVTTLCSAGDPALLGPTCDAAERYRTVTDTEIASLAEMPAYGDIFV